MPRNRSHDKLDALTYVSNHVCLNAKVEFWLKSGHGISTRSIAFDEVEWEGGRYRTLQEAIEAMADGLRGNNANFLSEDES